MRSSDHSRDLLLELGGNTWLLKSCHLVTILCFHQRHTVLKPKPINSLNFLAGLAALCFFLFLFSNFINYSRSSESSYTPCKFGKIYPPLPKGWYFSSILRGERNHFEHPCDHLLHLGHGKSDAEKISLPMARANDLRMGRINKSFCTADGSESFPLWDKSVLGYESDGLAI